MAGRHRRAGGGAVEAVRHGESGLLVNGETVDEIAAAINAVLGTKPLRVRLEAGACAMPGQQLVKSGPDLSGSLQKLQTTGAQYG